MRAGEQGFWRFICERQAIWHRRNALGLDPPWTDDLVLRRYHFTNVYRELDTGTRWFWELRRQRGLRTAWDVLWASLCYRPVNRIETFERHDGPPAPDSDSVAKWLRLLRRDRKAGVRVFTGKHFTRGGEFYRQTLQYALANSIGLSLSLAKARTPQEAVGVIESIPHIGRFFGNQIYLDLVEAGAVPFTEDDWVELGPGAIAGLELIFGKAATHDDADRLIVSLRERQREAFAELGLEFHFWEGKELTLKNTEHALCEYYRYARATAAGSDAARTGRLHVAAYLRRQS